jgi:hypothetical protein
MGIPAFVVAGGHDHSVTTAYLRSALGLGDDGWWQALTDLPAILRRRVGLGRKLDFGIGVGSRPHPPAASREYPAHGLPFHDFAHAVGTLAEACTVIRRPPIIIGGRTTATLRVVAEHADLWNVAGGDIDDCVRRGALLDQFCADIGRDPASITRSIHLPIPKTSRTGSPVSSSPRRPERHGRCPLTAAPSPTSDPRTARR